MRTILIIVDPGHRHPAEAGTYNHIQTSIVAHFEKWWHHIPNAYMVRTELTPVEVFEWLKRVWPIPEEAHTLGPRTASSNSSVLVFDVTNSEYEGRLPNWAWLQKVSGSSGPLTETENLV